MTDPVPATSAPVQDRPRRPRRRGSRPGSPAAAPAAAAPQAAPRAPRRHHPLLDQLAAQYPRLFGESPQPLKRGIFEDLLAAHPELFEREALKAALAIHTRSTRYLQAVAAGQSRHDLAGQPVEAMAPEHVHHALLEVFRRRKPRDGEDPRAKLCARMLRAFEASGLSADAYTELVRSRDEAANAVLEEALAGWREQAARHEALLRAFEASGQTLAQFADSYGLNPGEAAQRLERARRARG